MGGPMIEAAHGEPVILERQTRGGRHLFYRLEVIQQPERARACGSGPKSSADRRPVDPPPVVELRIYEGQTFEQAKDITFLYNANFFLFATLEHARVMAHGRVQSPAANQPPVLTGMPVSGMAYLDRPVEAGYFLFPDLSVRHEGRYRLTFNLYEQTKDADDSDLVKPDEAAETGAEPQDSFDWRMEVKSHDFVVFSAKKFPGLSESTALSRTVAEQGCRVRIRRDVRMRRRDGKPNGSEFDKGEDEYVRRRRTQTPEVQSDFRQRSMSNESAQRTPYGSASQRRPSAMEYPPPPPPFGGSQPSGGHLTFGAQSSHYPRPREAGSHTSSVPPSPPYLPPHPASVGRSRYAPPTLPSQCLYAERPPSHHYPSSLPSPRTDGPSQAHDSTRLSMSYPTPISARSSITADDPIKVDPKYASRTSISDAHVTLPPLNNMLPTTVALPSMEHIVPLRSSKCGKRSFETFTMSTFVAEDEFSQKNHARPSPPDHEDEGEVRMLYNRGLGGYNEWDLKHKNHIANILNSEKT